MNWAAFGPAMFPYCSWRILLAARCSRGVSAVADTKLGGRGVMRHIPNNSRMHVPVVHTRHDERAATADDCVACDVRTAYNMLTHSIEILRALALGKRCHCSAAGKCSNTGLPVRGNDPTHDEICECFLTSKLAYAVFDVEGSLELMLHDADRLARMVDRRGDSPENEVLPFPALDAGDPVNRPWTDFTHSNFWPVDYCHLKAVLDTCKEKRVPNPTVCSASETSRCFDRIEHTSACLKPRKYCAAITGFPQIRPPGSDARYHS